MKNLGKVVFIAIYFLMACVGHANENIMKKMDFQNSVYNLVAPFFAGNYQNCTINGTSFEQSYNDWKNRITKEYKILREKKIGEYNSLQQYLNEAKQNEKLHRAPAILVFSDGSGNPYSDEYRVVDDVYVHRYILCHSFKSYQCSHGSLEDLKNHMYWINECNRRCENIWKKLENGPEIVAYYHDISGNEKSKVIEKVLESDGSDPVYDNLNMSDFYKEKLAELNRLVLSYKEALQPKNTKAKSEVLNDFIARENLKQFEGIIIKNKTAYEVYDKIKVKNKSKKNVYAIQEKALEPYVDVLVNKMTVLIEQMKDSGFSLSCDNNGNQFCKLIISTEDYYEHGGNIVYACSCGHNWSEHKFHFAEEKQSKSNKTGNLAIDYEIAMANVLANLDKPKLLPKDKIIKILRQYGVEI